VRLVATILVAALVSMPLAAQQQARVNIKLSPAGEAIARSYSKAPDAGLKTLVERLRGLQGQVRTLSNAPQLDLARLTQVMRQQEAVQGQIARRNNDRLLGLLGRLTPADRTAFVRGLANPVITQPGSPARR
jgi:TolA-binding protein